MIDVLQSVALEEILFPRLLLELGEEFHVEVEVFLSAFSHHAPSLLQQRYVLVLLLQNIDELLHHRVLQPVLGIRWVHSCLEQQSHHPLLCDEALFDSFKVVASEGDQLVELASERFQQVAFSSEDGHLVHVECDSAEQPGGAFAVGCFEVGSNRVIAAGAGDFLLIDAFEGTLFEQHHLLSSYQAVVVLPAQDQEAALPLLVLAQTHEVVDRGQRRQHPQAVRALQVEVVIEVDGHPVEVGSTLELGRSGYSLV